MLDENLVDEVIKFLVDFTEFDLQLLMHFQLDLKQQFTENEKYFSKHLKDEFQLEIYKLSENQKELELL
jgi:hypothetical protein